MFQPRLERVSEEEREEKKEKRQKTERERMRVGKGWHCSTMAELLFVVERRESGREGGRGIAALGIIRPADGATNSPMFLWRFTRFTNIARRNGI